jgi:hypothetical protein
VPVTLTATLDETTVRELLNELLPLRIDLGDENHANRWFQIQPPQLIEFVPDKGIRIQTSAQLHWTVAGMGIPFTISSVRLLLAPSIDAVKARLNLVVSIEDADLKNIPKAIDRGIVTQLNARLAHQNEAVGWSFGRTLAISLALPEKMAPLERFEMEAGAMHSTVTTDALRLELSVPMHLSRRPG